MRCKIHKHTPIDELTDRQWEEIGKCRPCNAPRYAKIKYGHGYQWPDDPMPVDWPKPPSLTEVDLDRMQEETGHQDADHGQDLLQCIDELRWYMARMGKP